MDNVLYNYQRLLALADDDPEYCQLRNDFIHRQREIRKTLICLSESDRALLTDYLGAFAAMEHRLVELACFQMQ